MNLTTALLDTRQLDEADRLAVGSGIPVIDLMENAGAAVAREINQRWTARAVVVLCGPGNNGGDGFVVARKLAESEWRVRVAFLGRHDQQSDAAIHHAEAWCGIIEPLAPAVLADADLVVDALFGSGLARPLEGAAAETLIAAAERKLPIVAVDVPSGLHGDTGENLGAVAAVLTVTFLRKKPGHLLLPGRSLCGEVVVADIGHPAFALAAIAPNLFENDPRLWIADLPWPQENGNKYTRGHALISGGYPMTGAARMAARAAARAGAGLTTIAVPAIALPIYATAMISIMVEPLSLPVEFDRLLRGPHVSALLIGPGAGTGVETRQRVLAMLGTKLPTLIDADALTAFRDDPAVLEHAIVGPCVLTPHDGEFARLFDTSGGRLVCARAAARRSGAVIVLKGSDTVIAAPDGRAIINSNAPATLATAGAGDVLGGFILGLLAQGMEPFPAAAAAVWMHGAAASGFGIGLLAEDLPDLLPDVLRHLHDLDLPNIVGRDRDRDAPIPDPSPESLSLAANLCWAD